MPESTFVDETLGHSRSLTTNHENVPGIEHSPKLASGSAPVPEMEYPSRSTTGSESQLPEDDRQEPVGSGPSEAVPPLYEEPRSMNEPLHLQTPPPLERSPSNTSSRKKYYEQDEDWDRIIPREVLCYLKVVFDGKPLSKKIRFYLDWQDNSSYSIVDEAAQKRLRDSPETINKEVWRIDGVCKLFRNEQACSSKALETKDQWFEVLHLIIAEFVTKPGNAYAKFHLEITWTYAASAKTVVEDSEEEYSKKIADLIDAGMKTNWRKEMFIPQKDFNAIMSQTVIEHLIDKDKSLKIMADADSLTGPIFDKKQFIRDVATSHKRLLALCVYEELDLICLWQMIKLNAKPATFPLDDSDKPSAAKKRKFKNLISNQWYFTAYQFPKPTGEKLHCIPLKDKDILPIEACGEVEPIGKGTSKNVYKVKIQPGHHRFTADKTCVFALKEFKTGCPFEDFERESEVLRKLLDRPHEHITPHYASWSQREHFFMLSPLAKCNLKEYWTDKRPRLGDRDFVLWELKQLRGLSDGLRHIYNLGGWHFDLKPQNLLVFEEGEAGGPTLKIADFGSAKIHAPRSGPRDGSNPTKNNYHGTSAYEAPDYVIRGETSRPYDVWTLGCIFLDMLTWTFGSQPSDVDTFSKARRQIKGGRLGDDTMFWYVEFDGKDYYTHWKPAVRKKLQALEDLCDSHKGRAVFKELVLTTSKMLRMHPLHRPKPYKIHNDMDRMILWAEEAVNEPDWNIQNLLMGGTLSNLKSETSRELDGDGVPVLAPLGSRMMDHKTLFSRPVSSKLTTMQDTEDDDRDLILMGSKPNLNLMGNESKSPYLIVDDVDRKSESSTPRLKGRSERPLIGLHGISPDCDAFGEAQTLVPSATGSEFPLPPKPRMSILFERRKGFPVEASGSAKRRSSFS